MGGGMKIPVSVMMVVIVTSAMMLMVCVSAANHTVGGDSGWDLSTNLALWSASASFFVNDSLVFRYTPAHDVIEVSKPDFLSCRINSPITVYNDGETVIPLNRPGTRYFICGRPHHCAMGLKLRVQVLDRQQPTTTTTSSSSPPQPTTTTTTSSSPPQPNNPEARSGGRPRPRPRPRPHLPPPRRGGEKGGWNDYDGGDDADHARAPCHSSSHINLGNSSLLNLSVSILAILSVIFPPAWRFQISFF